MRALLLIFAMAQLATTSEESVYQPGMVTSGGRAR